jgi:hypothetical protein
MKLRQARERLVVELRPQLAPQRGHEEPAAHADAPVDLPHGEVDAHRLERLAPRDHVLVHAVDQCAVEIEQEGGLRRGRQVVHDPRS